MQRAGAIQGQGGHRFTPANRQQVLFEHGVAAQHAAAFAPVGHGRQPGRRAAGSGREGITQLQPAAAGLVQCLGEPQAVGLHISRQGRLFLGISAEGALQAVIPVVAVQGPVEHHQATGQAPIGDRAL